MKAENDKPEAEFIFASLEFAASLMLMVAIIFGTYSAVSGYGYILTPIMASTKKLCLCKAEMNQRPKARNIEIVVTIVLYIIIILNTVFYLNQSTQWANILANTLKFMLVVYPFQAGFNLIDCYRKIQ